MAIADDFTIDYVNKRIRHTSGSDWYTVNALYSYLQDTFDDLDQMDDPIPMSAQTPTDYTLINGWFMDDDSFKYLKGGAIQTSGWGSGVIRQIAYDASGAGTPFAAGDLGRTITGTSTTDTGTILAYDTRTGTDIGIVFIRPDDSGDAFDNGSEAYTVTGSAAAGSFTAVSSTGEALWSNLYTLGTIQEDQSQQIYIVQYGTTLTSWWPESGSGTQHIDVLIKVKEGGVEIDDGSLTVYLRHYPASQAGDLYDHFTIDVSPGGRNAVPLATQNDLNNSTYATTIGSTIADVTVAFVNGTVTHGAVTGSFTNYESVTWPGGGSGVMMLDSSGTMTIGNASDTGPANGELITGTPSGATTTASANMTEAYTINKAFDQGTDQPYTVVVDCAGRALSQIYEYFKYVTRETSTFASYPVTRSSSGTLSHASQNGEHYIQAYTDNQTSANSFNPSKASPFGTYAGGKLFAAQGVWLENMASSDIQAFQLRDSDGDTQTPPNKQAIGVTNLLQNDRVTVFRTVTSGSSTINKSLYSSTTFNTTGSTQFIVSAAIQTDTPTTGTIRVVDYTDGSEECFLW